MKSLIIYYSHTGNNALLAETAAESLGADLFRIREQHTRTNKTIALDMILGRNPKLAALPADVGSYDLVIFMSPVWMFHIPAPARSCMKKIKKDIRRYAYISLSGGALGPNTKIPVELKKRLGKNLALFLDMNIKNFCTVEKNTDTSVTSEYKLEKHPEDLSRINTAVISAVKGIRV